MDEKEKSASEELRAMIREQVIGFWNFMKPNSEDPILWQIIKTILKIPIALFVALLSPVLLLILAIIFIIMI